MYLHEFQNIRISALAAAVPDRLEQIMDYAHLFPEGEIEKFSKSTGIYERYSAIGVGTTAADLCVAAAGEIFRRFEVDRDTIDGLVFLTQTPDYFALPTSCVIQSRLGLEKCGVVYDSNIGCTGFPFGIQMACAQLMSGCKRVLLLVGDSNTFETHFTKDTLLFGDCGIAALLERSEGAPSPIRVGIQTIGKGYQALFAPYGMYRHPLNNFCDERGIKDALAYNNKAIMQGADVFTFSITDAPKAAKEFYKHFSCAAEDFDLISIHQANKMIVDHVAKRIKAPREKVLWTLDRYGNTRGSSTALNICDYAQRQGPQESKNILNLAFGVGLNIALASFELDMSRVLPILKTSEVFQDGINNFTYFSDRNGA